MKLRALGLTIAVIGVGAPAAHASCVPSSEGEYRKRADAIFVGRVLAIRESDGRAKFRVRRVLKGALTKGTVIRVFARPYPSSVTMNWSPELGERWRVYVDRPGRRWITNDCMGTRRT